MRIARRRLAVVVAAATIVTTVAACGSSSSAGGGTSASGSSAGASASGTPSVGSLTIGLPGASTVPAALILAQQLGYFKKFGVNVTLVNSGSVEITEVAGGQIDMVFFGLSSAFSAAKSGRQTSIVYCMLGNTADGVQVPGNSPLKPLSSTGATLMQLAGKRVAVQGVGTATYGDAESINSYITSHGGKSMTLVSYISTASIAEALDAGTIDAAVGVPDYNASQIATGKVRILVSQTDPTLEQITGGHIAGAGLYGLKSNLEKKRPAVVAAISAIRAAWQYMETEPTATVAQELHDSSILSSLSASNLAQQLAYDKPFWNPDNGAISESEWNATLASFKTWGLGVDLSSPSFSYNGIVDMSYYDASQAPG